MEWIKADKLKPDQQKEVLVVRKNGRLDVAYWCDDSFLKTPGDDSGWFICLEEVFSEDSPKQSETIFFRIEEVVYWSELPTAP